LFFDGITVANPLKMRGKSTPGTQHGRGMMLRRALVVLAAFLVVTGPAVADVSHFKFGILKETSASEYSMAVETTRIPRKLKQSGFRFGVSFDNPGRDQIEWYEVVHLPSPVREVSGDLNRAESRTLRTDMQGGRDQHVVDHFWFDQGDPLGKHRLELIVNGVLKYSVDFEVVDR
jgi:hypothetical protein